MSSRKSSKKSTKGSKTRRHKPVRTFKAGIRDLAHSHKKQIDEAGVNSLNDALMDIAVKSVELGVQLQRSAKAKTLREVDMWASIRTICPRAKSELSGAVSQVKGWRHSVKEARKRGQTKLPSYRYQRTSHGKESAQWIPAAPVKKIMESQGRKSAYAAALLHLFLENLAITLVADSSKEAGKRINGAAVYNGIPSGVGIPDDVMVRRAGVGGNVYIEPALGGAKKKHSSKKGSRKKKSHKKKSQKKSNKKKSQKKKKRSSKKGSKKGSNK